MVTLGACPIVAGNISGSIANNTTWCAANSPYVVSGGVMVNSGVTLTIEPGTSVYLGPAANLVVTYGGRLLAEGATTAPIQFTREPSSTARWGSIVINGGEGSPENRLTYAYIEGNDFTAICTSRGNILLDHLTFGTTDRQYASLDGSSFLISNCYFPRATAQFEPILGTGGIKSGGRGIVRGCFFGNTSGYNDVIDFTGGNRNKNRPLIHICGNVFAGASDDMLDLDGTDAWIEGNIFLHAHKNGAPDSSSAISAGDHRLHTSQLTVMGNIFFDCDHAATVKEGDFFTMINNTIVHTTKTGGLDTASGIVCVRDLDPDPTAFGAGAYLEGNIIVDAEQLARNYVRWRTAVTFNNNILPFAWDGPGSGNTIADPLLKHVPQLSETYFTNWVDAQIMREWFSPLQGSPALGTGPNGRDQGGHVPIGASIAGEPSGTTDQTAVRLTVGVNRTGNSIPAYGWPNGAGYTHYKWRLDSGPWSAETSISVPISLTGLGEGPHYVEVTGKRDSGLYQDDPAFGSDAVVTRSRSWAVRRR